MRLRLAGDGNQIKYAIAVEITVGDREDAMAVLDWFGPEAGAFDDPAFHDLGVHNSDLGVDCVECHLVHESGADPGAFSLHPEHVRAQCARCHPEYGETFASLRPGF